MRCGAPGARGAWVRCDECTGAWVRSLWCSRTRRTRRHASRDAHSTIGRAVTNFVAGRPSNVAMTIRTRANSVIAPTLIACATMVLAAGHPATGAIAAESLKVTVKYTGKGDVDKTHRLWVWLFDSPDIGPGAIPVAEVSLEENGSAATFNGLTAQKVWIAVAYDEKGGFGGSAPPPSGSPVMLYGAESGAPAPVTPGEAVEVAISFDDSQRMP